MESVVVCGIIIVESLDMGCHVGVCMVLLNASFWTELNTIEQN